MTTTINNNEPKSEPEPKPTILTQLTSFDQTISKTIHIYTTNIIPTPFLKLMELTGDGRLWFPIVLSLLFTKSYFSISASVLVGLTFDIIIVGSLKHFFRRPRPRHNIHPMGPSFSVDHWSFPSGHASRTCFIAGFFWFSFYRHRILIWIWAVLTSVSRVVMGRHYVFDVLVGVFVGLLNAFIVFHLLMFYGLEI